jgi:hypothetical protein
MEVVDGRTSSLTRSTQTAEAVSPESDRPVVPDALIQWRGSDDARPGIAAKPP